MADQAGDVLDRDASVGEQRALRALNVQGRITIGVREEAAEQQHVGKRRSLKVVLDDGLCPTCNNVRLSQLENDVKPIFAPMAVEPRPTTLTPATQKLLATWAVKTVFLLELAIRQKYPGIRPVEGYLAAAPEMAWMFANLEPPPRSIVWLGCWDSQREVPLNYAPSSAPLPTRDGKPVEGHFATFTLGYVAFQVFTVDFTAADRHGADQWNTHPPPSLAQALTRIWPQLLAARNIDWPPPGLQEGRLGHARHLERCASSPGRMIPLAETYAGSFGMAPTDLGHYDDLITEPKS